LCTCTHKFSSLLVSKAFPIEVKRIPENDPMETRRVDEPGL
jgi:hypothetical protein